MFFEPGDCIDVLTIPVTFNTEISLTNFYNATKALVQFYVDRNDFAPDFDLYDDTIQSPVALISEHFKKTAALPDKNGLLINQFGIYELIGANNIKNCSILNLLSNGHELKVRVSYYK